jgi:hypothetical protein
LYTHLVDDRLGEHVDFTWQTEAGERDGKVNALLAIVDTLVYLLNGQRRQRIRDTLRDRHFECIEDGAGGVSSGNIWQRWQFERHRPDGLRGKWAGSTVG